MEQTLRFLTELRNRNRESWFRAHESEWLEIEAKFHALVVELIERIGEFDPRIRGLRLEQCIHPLARDTRFSLDQRPYRTWLGAYIGPKNGKYSVYASYCFHIQPQVLWNDWGHHLTAGLYDPNHEVLRCLRKGIMERGREIEEAVEMAKGFSFYEGRVLRRNPKNFPSCLYNDWLRMKDFQLELPIFDEWLLAPNLAERAAEEFRKTYPFMNLINSLLEGNVDDFCS